jgi:hypothetical protein
VLNFRHASAKLALMSSNELVGMNVLIKVWAAATQTLGADWNTRGLNTVKPSD